MFIYLCSTSVVCFKLWNNARLTFRIIPEPLSYQWMKSSCWILLPVILNSSLSSSNWLGLCTSFSSILQMPVHFPLYAKRYHCSFLSALHIVYDSHRHVPYLPSFMGSPQFLLFVLVSHLILRASFSIARFHSLSSHLAQILAEEMLCSRKWN